eukprot:5410632-Ditylum_brightwellii.AAC.1
MEQYGQPREPEEEVLNKSTELSKTCVWMEQPNTKGERKRDQRGTNNPPAVPISHLTSHNMELQVPKGDTLHQNGPNSGSKGKECSAMEHGRSEVGSVSKELKKLTVELAINLSTEPQPRKKFERNNLMLEAENSELKKCKTVPNLDEKQKHNPDIIKHLTDIVDNEKDIDNKPKTKTSQAECM